MLLFTDYKSAYAQELSDKLEARDPSGKINELS
jgi:hypothetical protein